MPASASRSPKRSERVLRSAVVVMDQPGQVGVAFAPPGPDGLLERVQDDAGGHRGGGPPAEDPAGVGVDDERDVDPARPGRDIGQVGHPQPVRRRRGEVAAPTRSAGRSAAGSAIVVRLTLPRTAPRRPNAPHQPLHRAAGHRDAFPVQLQPHLPGPVDAEVRRVDPVDLDLQLLVADLPRRRRRRAAGRSRSTGRSADRAR